MSNKKLMTAMAMALAMGASVYDEVYDEPSGSKERRPYTPEGHKCGECVKFKTSRCRCTLAKETSPACSQITIK